MKTPHEEVFEDVTNAVLGMTLDQAMSDGGLWSDGTYLWFRQLRLCRLKLYREGDNPLCEWSKLDFKDQY